MVGIGLNFLLYGFSLLSDIVNDFISCFCFFLVKCDGRGMGGGGGGIVFFFVGFINGFFCVVLKFS